MIISVEKKIYIFILSSFLPLISAQQNLCNEAKAKGLTWAPDPSDCTRYLWCDRNATDSSVIVKVYYLQCNQNSEFKYFLNDKCVTANTHCTNLCPPSGTSDYKIAVPAESCTSYRYCRLSAMAPSTCTIGGDYAAFDRNSGQCIDNTDGFLANCPSADQPTPPPLVPFNPCVNQTADFIGYVQGLYCSDWVFCYLQNIYDQGTCPCDQSFGDDANNCIEDTTCNACSTTPGATTTDAITTTSDSGATTTSSDTTTTFDTTTSSDTTTTFDTTTSSDTTTTFDTTTSSDTTTTDTTTTDTTTSSDTTTTI